MPDRVSGITSIRFLTKPTQTVYPKLRGEDLWYLISTLSLNCLSLLDSGDGRALKGLQRIMECYDLKNEARNKKLIKGIVSIEGKKQRSRYAAQGLRGWRRGLEMTVTFDPSFYRSGNAFLLGAVLERFFPLFLPETNFTTTVLKQMGSDEEWYRWPPRQGEIPTI